jgi:hypothetical protein
MAGLGRKVFTRGTLSSPDVNGYLMDQTVMAFADAAQRDAMVPAPWEGAQCVLTGAVKRRQAYTAGGWQNLPRAVAGGYFTGTTSAGGDVLLATGLPAAPTYVLLTMTGTANSAVYAKSVASTASTATVSVRTYDTRTGAVWASAGVDFAWQAVLL